MVGYNMVQKYFGKFQPSEQSAPTLQTTDGIAMPITFA